MQVNKPKQRKYRTNKLYSGSLLFLTTPGKQTIG